MNEIKRCPYWPVRCAHIEDISGEDPEKASKLMQRYCRVEDYRECSAYSFNESVNVDLRALTESAREINDPLIKFLMQLISNASEVVFSEMRREEARHMKTYRVVLAELRKSAEEIKI